MVQKVKVNKMSIYAKQWSQAIPPAKIVLTVQKTFTKAAQN